MSKANRQKGVKREQFRFSCLTHANPHRGPVRFKHSDARHDWDVHNLVEHGGKRTTRSREEAIALLLTQSIDGQPSGVLDWGI